MGTLERIKAALTPTGLYNIEKGSLIYAELSAYAEGLDLLNEEIKIVEGECFVSTSETYGLLMREHLIGVLKNTLPTENRREMIMYQSGISKKDFTKESMEKVLVACGIVGTISEYPSEQKIHINCIKILDNILTREQIKSEAYKYLPPHLDVTFDFRNFSWSIIEDKNMTFSQMDNKNMTWSEIDTYEEE